MSLFLIAALPFLGAVFPALLIRAGRNACSAAAGLVTLVALISVLLHAPAVFSGSVITARAEWLPGLGLNAHFFMDPLGFFFATLILGIGLLIIIYARYYLSREDPMGQFYAYLLLFQGAMVGIVLSDNILLLVVFWELTSLSSFLLIGYWRHLPEGRQGARMALAVTGAGGLALIGGMLILGNIAGSYDLSVILQNKDAIQADPLYTTALVLILLGCFTKSAQFPFHFWLPHAMAAPTPVSAYLHSATMVKAGLFLMARLWPVLAGTPEWFYLVATTGLLTMLIGAVIALFKDDLKALLAFSTVSHLGLITMLLGMGTEAAARAAVFHIINHATFKAALFMSAGIIDHETHTRDIKRLGGLRFLMPLTFTLATIASLSMAGIPPFNGFLSKELMLEETAHTTWLGNPWIVPALATLAALFSAAYSFRYIVHVFLGPKREDYPHTPHDPGPGLWLSPALLVTLVVAIGLFPEALVGGIVNTVSDAVTGHHGHHHALALWHGVTPALMMSGVAVLGGALLLALRMPRDKAIFGGYLFLGLLGAMGLIQLRLQPELPFWLVPWLILVVVASDVAGYFAGRILGGPKFWPRVSPKKTWSGTIAGWLLAGAIGGYLGVFLGLGWHWNFALISAVLAFAGQMGDIAESAIKRHMSVKDSSNLIPGHGGVLDRFDGLIAVSALAYLLILSRLFDTEMG